MIDRFVLFLPFEKYINVYLIHFNVSRLNFFIAKTESKQIKRSLDWNKCIKY